jgi:hypothetical protein
MRTIKNTVYKKRDFKHVIIPTWQRWVNAKNLNDLAEAVSEQGQMRDVLICITKDGTKILTDGNHLRIAMLDLLKIKEISVKEIYVEDEVDARKAFISFNTRGKSLKAIDYIVSYSGANKTNYKRFLTEVMLSPKTLKDATDVHGKLFSVPALIQIFLGKSQAVKNGNAKLPVNFERILSLVEYLGQNYLFNGNIVSHLKKNGKSMKLNGGSIIPVISRIKRNKEILSKSNKEILKILIEFTTFHFNSMESCSFTKDAVDKSFATYLQNIR